MSRIISRLVLRCKVLSPRGCSSVFKITGWVNAVQHGLLIPYTKHVPYPMCVKNKMRWGLNIKNRCLNKQARV